MVIDNKTGQRQKAISYLTGMFGYDMNLGKCEYIEVRPQTAVYLKLTAETPEVRSDPGLTLFARQSALNSINQHQSASIRINQRQSESFSINQHQSQ